MQAAHVLLDREQRSCPLERPVGQVRRGRAEQATREAQVCRLVDVEPAAEVRDDLGAEVVVDDRVHVRRVGLRRHAHARGVHARACEERDRCDLVALPAEQRHVPRARRERAVERRRVVHGVRLLRRPHPEEDAHVRRVLVFVAEPHLGDGEVVDALPGSVGRCERERLRGLLRVDRVEVAAERGVRVEVGR